MIIKEIMKPQMKENDGKHLQEVTILQGERTLLKVELGTTLKVVKLLCANEGMKNNQILGVRPVTDDDQIPCIVTLDETKLEEHSYQLLIPDTKSKSEVKSENGNDFYKCEECAVKESKEFISTGINTDISMPESPVKERKEATFPKVKNEKFVPESVLKEDLHRAANESQLTRKLYNIPSPPRNEIDAYRNLQEVTRKIYTRQPGMESIAHDPQKYIPSFIDTMFFEKSFTKHYDEVYRAQKAYRVKEDRASLSPNDHRRNINFTDSDLRPYRPRPNIRKIYGPADRLPLYEMNQLKDNQNNTTKAIHEPPPTLLLADERAKRKRFLPEHPPERGEEPPVYVLPNDFDMTNGDSGVIPKNEAAQISPPYRPSDFVRLFDREEDLQRSAKIPREEPSRQSSPQNLQNVSGSSGDDRNESPDSSTNSEAKLHCKICNSSFSSKSLLYKHLRGHTSDEKPFKCNECGQGFTLSSNLRQHRIIHRGYKPFQCEFCGKKFMRSNVYKQHRRIHTGEEMHKCTLCPSEFLQKYALIKHMKKNHNIDSTDL